MKNEKDDGRPHSIFGFESVIDADFPEEVSRWLGECLALGATADQVMDAWTAARAKAPRCCGPTPSYMRDEMARYKASLAAVNGSAP